MPSASSFFPPFGKSGTMGAVAPSGIGRRRGASSGGKSSKIGPLVVVVSFSLTLFVVLVFGYVASYPSSTTRTGGGTGISKLKDKLRVAKDKLRVIRKNASADDGKLGEIVRGELNLIAINAFGLLSNEYASKNGDSGATYQGAKATFCKIDWDKYKEDPPSLPMFKFLVSASKCDEKHNTVTMDLATVVQKTREYDKRQSPNDGGAHVIPPTGFVFHESRVGSTLVANSLTVMDRKGHRVYSESQPINEALAACQGLLSTCNVETNVELLRDVVYLMGRTSSPEERRMFFKVSSVGSKRIDVVRRAFPSVPWIFVYRDPVQTMMSHLDPAKVEKKAVRGKGATPVCLRAQKHPPEDLIQLVDQYEEDFDELSNESFCALHLATLCESALRGFRKQDGKGVAVDHHVLVDKLIQSVIPNHFGVEIDEAAIQRIRDVAKIYSKIKTGTDKDWVEDSRTKYMRATPEIREASETFLSESYAELKKYDVK